MTSPFVVDFVGGLPSADVKASGMRSSPKYLREMDVSAISAIYGYLFSGRDLNRQCPLRPGRTRQMCKHSAPAVVLRPRNPDCAALHPGYACFFMVVVACPSLEDRSSARQSLLQG